VSRLVWPSCCGPCWAQFRGTLVWLFGVGGRTFPKIPALEEHLVFAQEFAVWLLVVEISGIEVLKWRVIPSFQAISTAVQRQGRVTLQTVFLVFGGRLRWIVQQPCVKSVVVFVVSRRVRVKAAEVQHRLKAVKIYIFWRTAASWGNL